MKAVRLIAVLAVTMTGMLASSLQAQDLHPSRRLSPLGMARSFVGESYVKVTFSQPYKRGRDNIFGAQGSGSLHEYGAVWRFGANEPTEITFSGPVSFGGERVDAGTYSIFATPGESAWTLHLNALQGGGANEYDAERNVAEVTVEAMAVEEEVDQFTIALEEHGDGLNMVATWLDWKLLVPIQAAE